MEPLDQPDRAVKADLSQEAISIIRDSEDRALNAAGTAEILEARAAVLASRLKWLTFVSLVVPIVVGGIVLGYGAGLPALGLIIAVAAGVTVLQIAISLWALAAAWVDAYSRAVRSAIRNRQLVQDFQRVVRKAHEHAPNAQVIYEYHRGQDDVQQAEDYVLGFSPAEKRAAHRAGLRMLGRKCSACEIIPTDMNPTDCGVCGDFRKSRWTRRYTSSKSPAQRSATSQPS